MKVECKECHNKIDLKDMAAIMFYLQNGPLKCPKCGKDIYFKNEE